MRNGTLLFLLALIASSGCIDDGEGRGITVERITVEPHQIVEGSDVTVTVEAVNTGLLEGKVFPGNNNTNILTNYCPDYFGIENTELTTSRTSEQSKNSYLLDEGDRIEVSWRLSQKSSARIPLPGYECSLRFELPFNYSTRTYKQIQVLEDSEVETEAELQSDVSEGPLTFDMELIGSKAKRHNTMFKGENTSIYITSYNREPEDESRYKGVIEMSKIKLNSTGVIGIRNKDKCLEKGTAVLAEGEKKIYRCDIEINNSAYAPPSSRGEVTARVNYTYVRDLGERSVRVERSGQ